jgi:hypothetical protein
MTRRRQINDAQTNVAKDKITISLLWGLTVISGSTCPPFPAFDLKTRYPCIIRTAVVNGIDHEPDILRRDKVR